MKKYNNKNSLNNAMVAEYNSNTLNTTTMIAGNSRKTL